VKIECAWCGKPLGEGEGEGISHGICPDCKAKVMEEINQLAVMGGYQAKGAAP